MKSFETSVQLHMHTTVHTIGEHQSLTEAAAELEGRGISALGVVDRQGALVGVVSRTDLLGAGRRRSPRYSDRKTLSLPDARVREFMTSTVEIIAPSRPLYEAARSMLQRDLHRLFVSEDRRPIGLVGTREMMRAVIDARLAGPVSEIMHVAVISVEAHRPVAYALERMNAVDRSGLVVTEDGWPVGVFTQADALFARDAKPDERVDEWMDPRISCLPMATPVWRAAQQAIATRTRRLLAVDKRGVRGIVTATDFVRLVAAQAA